MIKLAARIFDIYDDTELDVASKLGSAFASLEVADRDEVEELPDASFGLILKTAGGAIRRRYPLHTADAQKLSRAYFDAVKSTLPAALVETVEAKLAAVEKNDAEAAAKIAYVDGTSLKPGREKIAFGERHWGLVIDGENKFPLHDADLVKLAAARFAQTAEGLEPEEAFMYARNILKRAAETKVKLADDSRVHLYGNDEVNLRSLKEAIVDRRQILKAAGISTDILDQLEEAAGCESEAGAIESSDSFRLRAAKLAHMAEHGLRNDPAKLISVLQNVDKVAGLSRSDYLHGLLDPFAACYKTDTITKRAAMIVDGVDLSTVSPEALAGKFDPEFCTQFQQQPVNAYKSLPAAMQQIVKQLSGDPAAGAEADKHLGSAGHGDPEQLLNPTLVNSITLGV
jgi:hypothetical protein